MFFLIHQYLLSPTATSKLSAPDSSQKVEVLINFFAFSKFLLKFCLGQPYCNIIFNVSGFVLSQSLHWYMIYTPKALKIK